MASKIMAELLKAAGMKEPKTVDQKFLQTLRKNADTAFDENEEIWEKLSPKAQNWFNAAATAVKKQADIADFPDADTPDAGGTAEGDEDVAKKAAKKAPAKKAAADEKAPAKKAAAKDDKAPAKKAAAPAKKAAADKPKKSMLKFVRELICNNIALSAEQLTQKLEKAGYEASPLTVGTIRSDTRNTLKIAQEQGVDLKKLDFDA